MSVPRHPHDPDRIAAQIRSLASVEGRAVMVHASLRRIGVVAGGAGGLLAAIRDALGPEGTMLMVLAADDREPFDRLTTPADPEMGALAEAFRRHPGVEVNDHPACRFGAWGPAASELLYPQPHHDYYGPGSPLERLCAHDGAVLRLGADADTVTLTHYAEYRADLAEKRTVRRLYTRADTGPLVVDSLDDTDGIAVWEHGDYFPRVLQDFIDQGLADVGQVGDTEAELLGARRFVDFATRWLERNLS